MNAEEWLDCNAMDNFIVHIRNKMDRRGEMEYTLSDVIEQYVEYLEEQKQIELRTPKPLVITNRPFRH